MSEVKSDPGEVVGPRRRRSARERLQIVKESDVHGMSVALVARKQGANANQVFQWQRWLGSSVSAGTLSIAMIPSRK